MKIETFIVGAVDLLKQDKNLHFDSNESGVFDAIFSNLDEYSQYSVNDRNFYDFSELNVLQNVLALIESTDFAKIDNKDIRILIEQNKYQSLVFPSINAAALISIITFCGKSGHVLISDTIRYLNLPFIKNFLANLYIEVEYYNHILSLNDIEKKFKHNTKMIVMESISSVTLKVPDINNIVNFAKNNQIITMMDNSYATSFYFQPLLNGIDISISSFGGYIKCDKQQIAYISSKSDLLENVKSVYDGFGLSVNSNECNFIISNLLYVAMKLRQSSKNAAKIVNHFHTLNEVKHVFSPNLGCNQNLLSGFSGFPGFVTIILDKHYSSISMSNMLDHMLFFDLSRSWGGLKSSVMYIDLADFMSCNQSYIGNCLQFYLGSEDINDLIFDIDGAFARLRL